MKRNREPFTLEAPMLFTKELEPVEKYRRWVKASDWHYAHAELAPKRCQEYLAWRALLSRIIGYRTEVRYNDVGAPYTPAHKDLHISVSHGAGRISLLLSNHPCCVDVESLSRRFEAIQSRYMTPEEMTLPLTKALPLASHETDEITNDDHLRAAIVWSAKEALYKLSGKRGLCLKEDIHIESIALTGYIAAGECIGRIQGGEPITLYLDILEDAVVLYKL